MHEMILISKGDFRQQVSVACWPKQVETLEKVEAVLDVLKIPHIASLLKLHKGSILFLCNFDGNFINNVDNQRKRLRLMLAI